MANIRRNVFGEVYNVDGEQLLDDLLLVALAKELVELGAFFLLVAVLGDALDEERDDHPPEEAPLAIELLALQLVPA